MKDTSLEALKEEIAKKREALQNPFVWPASKRDTPEYRSEIAKIARNRIKVNPSPITKATSMGSGSTNLGRAHRRATLRHSKVRTEAAPDFDVRRRYG